jgi:hypothetical protein
MVRPGKTIGRSPHPGGLDMSASPSARPPDIRLRTHAAAARLAAVVLGLVGSDRAETEIARGIDPARVLPRQLEARIGLNPDRLAEAAGRPALSY